MLLTKNTFSSISIKLIICYNNHDLLGTSLGAAVASVAHLNRDVLSFPVLWLLYPAILGQAIPSAFGLLGLAKTIWVIDMIVQLTPARGYLALGSLKQFRNFYEPAKELINKRELISFFRKNELDSLKVLGVWTMLVVGIGVLWIAKVLTEKELLLISVAFYVCDLICVLYWCPFRVWILKNRCCTTCRIFNWDHLMMFSPLLFISGFYSGSLLVIAVIVFLVWETCFILHPKRFCEDTNAALLCCNCTDKLCVKQKL